jgi:hypothetical protein
MAKSISTSTFQRLRDSGLRKSTAKQLTRAIENGNKRTPKQVRDLLTELRGAITEAEDRVKGGPAKRKAAAKKGVATRKRAARKRSEAAKKAAATRRRNKR